jgi:lipopolysaccharide heptosyltransferase II
VPDTPNITQYPARWDWSAVERILLVRLRSIGDAVLTTPSIVALRRFVPNAQIDILLEDWVAPVFDGFTGLDNVVTFVPDSVFDRVRLSQTLRKRKYDVVYNMHGGSTSAFFTVATRAKHRVGFGHYRYGKIYDHLAIPAVEFWGTEKLHSAEQQLALLGWTGVPVADRPRTSLAVTPENDAGIVAKLRKFGLPENAPFALFHPAAAFSSKEWAAEKFAALAEYLAGKGVATVAVAGANEEIVLRRVREKAAVPVYTFSDLKLPEITALSARANLFVGNDSGIAHIAAAVGTPCVVIFGSSNIDHWRPYTEALNHVISNGGIENVTVEMVREAVEDILAERS